MAGNKITDIPDVFSGLKNLLQLDLSSNKLTGISKNILALDKLESLKLSDNKIKNVSKDINKLKNLQSLELQNNEITELPDTIVTLKKLETLYIHSNKLKKLPIKIGQLENLKSLTAQNNNLRELPTSLATLAALEQLTLQYNELVKVPSGLAELSNLELLYLDHNSIVRLPSKLDGLKKLQQLMLNDNQLTSLPTALIKLVNLEILTLENNLLKGDATIKVGNKSFVVGKQDQLKWNTKKIVKVINSKKELLTKAELITMLTLASGRALSSEHNFIFEGYFDKNGKKVNLSNYFSGDKIIESGELFIRIRSEGDGLYPNNSEHAVTENFKYVLTAEGKNDGANTDNKDKDEIFPDDKKGNGKNDSSEKGSIEKIIAETENKILEGETSWLPQTGADKNNGLGLIGWAASLMGLVLLRRKR